MKNKQIFNIVAIVFLSFMMVMPALAAPGNYTGKDFVHDRMNLQDAQKQVDESALGAPIQMFSNYVLYAYVCGIIGYMLLLLKWFFADGGEGKGKAFIGAIALVAFVALQWSLTIEAINFVAGN